MTQANSSSQKTDPAILIGSTILFVYIILSVIIFGTVILLCAWMPFTVRYRLSLYWIQALLWVTKVCCQLTYQVEGLENLPKEGAYIVLSKHQSAWETLALRLILPTQTAVLKKSLTRIPIGGWALATLKPIAIDRESPREALRSLIEQGIERLQQGLIVVIFPEGTRAAPGEELPFNAGGAMLAQKSGYPVIPLAHNAGKFWPRYSFLKYPGVIQVKIGSVIETTGKKAKQINQQAETWINQTMQELS